MRLTRLAACRSVVGCLFALSLAAPALAQPRAATVLDLAAQQKNLTTFVQAVHTAGLDDVLKGPGPITVYAPTDEAFAKLPAGERDALLGSPDRLRTLILGHLVKERVMMHDGDAAVTSGSVANAAGRELAFGTDDRDRQTVGGARLLATDLRADNGCVNVIDRVLM
jgi:uncharacterized surface protein with fasciclin (FAS1) repeats